LPISIGHRSSSHDLAIEKEIEIQLKAKLAKLDIHSRSPFARALLFCQFAILLFCWTFHWVESIQSNWRSPL